MCTDRNVTIDILITLAIQRAFYRRLSCDSVKIRIQLKGADGCS